MALFAREPGFERIYFFDNASCLAAYSNQSFALDALANISSLVTPPPELRVVDLPPPNPVQQSTPTATLLIQHPSSMSEDQLRGMLRGLGGFEDLLTVKDRSSLATSALARYKNVSFASEALSTLKRTTNLHCTFWNPDEPLMPTASRELPRPHSRHLSLTDLASHAHHSLHGGAARPFVSNPLDMTSLMDVLNLGAPSSSTGSTAGGSIGSAINPPNARSDGILNRTHSSHSILALGSRAPGSRVSSANMPITTASSGLPSLDAIAAVLTAGAQPADRGIATSSSAASGNPGMPSQPMTGDYSFARMMGRLGPTSAEDAQHSFGDFSWPPSDPIPPELAGTELWTSLAASLSSAAGQPARSSTTHAQSTGTQPSNASNPLPVSASASASASAPERATQSPHPSAAPAAEATEAIARASSTTAAAVASGGSVPLPSSSSTSRPAADSSCKAEMDKPLADSSGERHAEHSRDRNRRSSNRDNTGTGRLSSASVGNDAGASGDASSGSDRRGSGAREPSSRQSKRASGTTTDANVNTSSAQPQAPISSLQSRTLHISRRNPQEPAPADYKLRLKMFAVDTLRAVQIIFGRARPMASTPGREFAYVCFRSQREASDAIPRIQTQFPNLSSDFARKEVVPTERLSPGAPCETIVLDDEGLLSLEEARLWMQTLYTGFKSLGRIGTETHIVFDTMGHARRALEDLNRSTGFQCLYASTFRCEFDANGVGVSLLEGPVAAPVSGGASGVSGSNSGGGGGRGNGLRGGAGQDGRDGRSGGGRSGSGRNGQRDSDGSRTGGEGRNGGHREINGHCGSDGGNGSGHSGRNRRSASLALPSAPGRPAAGEPVRRGGRPPPVSKEERASVSETDGAAAIPASAADQEEGGHGDQGDDDAAAGATRRRRTRRGGRRNNNNSNSSNNDPSATAASDGTGNADAAVSSSSTNTAGRAARNGRPPLNAAASSTAVSAQDRRR
ncbi:hypothetical protein BC831DRAFT_479346 [Entophlyctis helioformis]|nr:hypothetical protein BC831DRAFT_479346 [Entophlyctis helioformis]